MNPNTRNPVRFLNFHPCFFPLVNEGISSLAPRIAIYRSNCPGNKSRSFNIHNKTQVEKLYANIDPPSESEMDIFFKEIKSKPAILKIINPHADDFIPVPTLPSLCKQGCYTLC